MMGQTSVDSRWQGSLAACGLSYWANPLWSAPKTENGSLARCCQSSGFPMSLHPQTSHALTCFHALNTFIVFAQSCDLEKSLDSRLGFLNAMLHPTLCLLETSTSLRMKNIYHMEAGWNCWLGTTLMQFVAVCFCQILRSVWNIQTATFACCTLHWTYYTTS